jgi:hypothetical protein
MPMTPFHMKFPEIAESEFRAATIADHPHIPDGKYGLVELYCDDVGCDCRRVFIQVLRPNERAEAPLATINFGWENEAFYRDWLGDPDDAESVANLKGPSLPPAEQSELAPHFLMIYRTMVQEEDYVKQLRQHYALFRQDVELPQRKRKENAASGPAGSLAIDELIGPNQPCPCGSGRKFKKCCGRKS